uniref:Uncharacterized protein n=1 Tax=Amphimedon queenslandica TaxID=400682 RepID=A0A1X7UY48_AMPQE
MNDDNNKPSDSEDDNENDENQNEYDDDDDDDVDKIDTDDSESDESDALEVHEDRMSVDSLHELMEHDNDDFIPPACSLIMNLSCDAEIEEMDVENLPDKSCKNVFYISSSNFTSFKIIGDNVDKNVNP